MNKFSNDFKFHCVFNKGVIYRAIRAGSLFVITWEFDSENSIVMSEQKFAKHFMDKEYYFV